MNDTPNKGVEMVTLTKRLADAITFIKGGGRGLELGRREIVFVKQELEKIQAIIDEDQRGSYSRQAGAELLKELERI